MSKIPITNKFFIPANTIQLKEPRSWRVCVELDTSYLKTSWIEKLFFYLHDCIPCSISPNHEKKSLKHSKDPRNCPIVLYFDTGHFTHISFLLQDPVVVMPVQYTPMSLNDFIATYKVKKTPTRIYRTYRKVVHNFVYNMIFNIMKHQQEEEENVQEARKEEAMAIEPIKGTKRKLAEQK